MEAEKMSYLKKQLERKQSRVRLRYRYYEGKKEAERFGRTLPDQFKYTRKPRPAE